MSSRIFMKKVYLVNDTINSKNLGCQLVSHMIRRSMDSLFKGKYSLKTVKLNNRINETQKNEMLSSDIVYVNGEGSLSGGGSPAIKEATKIALKNNKKVYFCNFTFDPRNQATMFHRSKPTRQEVWANTSEWMSIFNQCEKVIVRDPISYVYLHDAGLKKVELAVDIGTTIFLQKEYNAEKIEREQDTIMFGAGAITKAAQVNNYNTVKVFDQVIKHFAAKGFQCNIMNWASNPISDLQFLKSVHGQNINHIDVDFAGYYKQCKKSILNVTGRHHGTVMSFAAECPFITFDSNMWKTLGDHILYDGVDFIDIYNLRADFFIESIEKAVDQRIKNLQNAKNSLKLYEDYLDKQISLIETTGDSICKNERLFEIINKSRKMKTKLLGEL